MQNIESVYVDIIDNNVNINVNGDNETLLATIYFLCHAYRQANGLKDLQDVFDDLEYLEGDVYEA